MKLTSILKALLLSLMMCTFNACQEEYSPIADTENTEVAQIMLDIDQLTLESANIRVRHTGSSDMMWIYMYTPDLETPAAELLEEKIANDADLLGEVIVYKGMNKSVVVSGLSPKTYYRFICQAIDPVSGNLIGEVSELEFRTKRDPAYFEKNPNWTITRGERYVDNADKLEYDNFIVKSTDDENYVLLTLKASDYASEFKNQIRPCFEEYVADFGLEVGDSKWQNIIKKGDNEFAEQRLRSGDWCVFLIGLDPDGELSGYYQQFDFTIAEETATVAYEKWFGKWMVYNPSTGADMFAINILHSENNMWYYLAGWESDNLYFDTTAPEMLIETYFDKENGRMCFVSQYVNTMVSSAETLDFYFSGTFTYGQNYVVDAMNARMAEAKFMGDENTARIEGVKHSANGLQFDIEAVCYFYYYNGNSTPGVISSLGVPTFPLEMRRIN